MMIVGSEGLIKVDVVRRSDGSNEVLGSFYTLRIPQIKESIEIEGNFYTVFDIEHVLSKTIDSKIRLVII